MLAILAAYSGAGTEHEGALVRNDGLLINHHSSMGDSIRRGYHPHYGRTILWLDHSSLTNDLVPNSPLCMNIHAIHLDTISTLDADQAPPPPSSLCLYSLLPFLQRKAIKPRWEFLVIQTGTDFGSRTADQISRELLTIWDNCSTACSPQAEVFAYAAAQVKKAMDVSHRLGAENYVFW